MTLLSAPREDNTSILRMLFTLSNTSISLWDVRYNIATHVHQQNIKILNLVWLSPCVFVNSLVGSGLRQNGDKKNKQAHLVLGHSHRVLAGLHVVL